MTEMTDRQHPQYLDCEAHRVALSSALDGEIDPVSFGETLGHLAECADCRHFVTASRALDTTLAARAVAREPIEPKPVSAALWKRVAAEAWPTSAGSSPRSRVPQRWAWGLAAALLVTLAGLGLWDSVRGGAIAQEALTEEGGRASEFNPRSTPGSAQAARVVNDGGRQQGGNSR